MTRACTRARVHDDALVHRVGATLNAMHTKRSSSEMTRHTKRLLPLPLGS